MDKLSHLLIAGILAPAALCAQVLEPPAHAEAAETVSIDQPSRYAGKEVNAYVEELAATFSIRARATDPFGLVQDPSAPVAKPKPVAAADPSTAAAPVSYTQIISQIPVTTVIPGEGRFLVGTRSFKTGDRFPVAYHGRNFPSEVLQVSASRIALKNLESSEIGIIQLDLVPQDLQKAAAQPAPAGVRAVNPVAPLEVDSPSAPPDGSTGGLNH